MSTEAGIIRAPDPQPFPPARVLILSVTSYRHLNDLTGPESDGIEIGYALREHGGCDVTRRHGLTAAEMLGELEVFLRSFSPEETAVVYFSGHGHRVDDTLFLMAADSRIDKPVSTAVKAADLRKLLDECHARAKVVIMDCCHAGAMGEHTRNVALFKGVQGLEGLTSERPRRAGGKGPGAQGRGLVILAASLSDEQAADGLSGSPYTRAMVQGILTGAADTDRDGWVSAEELAHYVHDLVLTTEQLEPCHFVEGGAGRIRLTRTRRYLDTADQHERENTHTGGDSAHRATRTVEEKSQKTAVPRRSMPVPDGLAWVCLVSAVVVTFVWLAILGRSATAAGLCAAAVGVLAFVAYSATLRALRS